MTDPRRQCAKCPWKTSTDPHDIPRGYCETKHANLKVTIAGPEPMDSIRSRDLRIMACHETHETPCVGWLENQLGPGNNLGLRLAVMQGSVDGNFETVGDQHPTFLNTLPQFFEYYAGGLERRGVSIIDRA